MKSVKRLLVLASFTASMIIFFSCKKDAENSPVSATAISTAAVSMITITSAEAGGNVISTGGAELISRGVCWGTSHNPTVTGSKTTDGNGTGTFISSLTDLTPNTTYYVRAYATNSLGTAYGNEISFKSNQVVVVPPTLTTLVVTAIAPTAARSGGYIINDGGETLTKMGICWGTAPNPTTNDSNESFAESLAPGVVSFGLSIDSLQPATKYYI